MIRYPGGKTKLKKHIIPIIQSSYEDNNQLYIEPFLGAGSIASSIIEISSFNHYLLNDKDLGIICIWKSIIENIDTLISEINKIVPSVEAFYTIKQKLSNNNDFLLQNFSIVEIAVMKIAIHQFSYSGLGLKAGGPIGGKNQKSSYSVGCRWNPKNIIKNIQKINKILSKKNITSDDIQNKDFEYVLSFGENYNSFYYLDPPYYEQGNSLYICGFLEKDHIRLQEILKKSKNKWLLSYDNNPYIKTLYEWANIKEISMKCTINGANSKIELLISNFDYQI